MNSATSTFTPDSSGTTPKQASVIPNLKLNDGNEIPMLAYGVGTAHYNGSDEHVSHVTQLAIKNGYTHLDGAEVYGNETGLGLAISQSGVPRSKLYVVTKLHGVKRQDVKAAFETSLQKLGVDYVDLYLVHAPFLAKDKADLQAIWRDVEAIRATGKARSIGVSNFRKPDLEAILETAKVVPAINQIEYHPYLQHTGGLVDFHREKGIAVAAYGPLTPVVREKGGPVDGAVEKLARKYGVTEGDVLLRWCMDQGIVTVTTSGSEQRLQGYMNKVPSFKLTPKEVEEIAELGKQKHYRAFWNERFAEDDTE